MIKIRNLTKEYGQNGNFNISLEINQGEVYGLIGANGSGKTTLIRQILGFIEPDSGSVEINGLVPFKNSKIIMDFSGYVSGEISLFENLSGYQYIKTAASFRKSTVDWSFVEKLILHFDLDANKKIKKMSKGMKQKIAIICAVMSKPALLVLDEPTSGLDILAARRFKEIVLKFKSEYKSTIIICSHMFDEVIKICDKVGIIKSGKLIEEIEINDIDETKLKEIFIEKIENKNIKDLF